ncbi:MAG: hypothetical protein ACM34K_18935 [Bacillota bacterium]
MVNLHSSPNTFAEFISSNGSSALNLVAKENDKMLLEAFKQITSGSGTLEFSKPDGETSKDH